MTPVLLIFLIGLTPALLSIWLIRKAGTRMRINLDSIANSIGVNRISASLLSSAYHYVDGVGYMIGDLTCRYNARSRYVRCAINPLGPCDNCRLYETHSLDSDDDV
jgi:Family of unknown function (DUF6464)